MICKSCGQDVKLVRIIHKDEEGLLHKEDGPAVESTDSPYKAYYVHGVLHREDGPAIVDANKDELYYVNGKLHREDGPAKCYYTKNQLEYFLNGEYIKKGDIPKRFPNYELKEDGTLQKKGAERPS